MPTPHARRSAPPRRGGKISPPRSTYIRAMSAARNPAPRPRAMMPPSRCSGDEVEIAPPTPSSRVGLSVTARWDDGDHNSANGAGEQRGHASGQIRPGTSGQDRHEVDRGADREVGGGRDLLPGARCRTVEPGDAGSSTSGTRDSREGGASRSAGRRQQTVAEASAQCSRSIRRSLSSTSLLLPSVIEVRSLQ